MGWADQSGSRDLNDQNPHSKYIPCHICHRFGTLIMGGIWFGSVPRIKMQPKASSPLPNSKVSGSPTLSPITVRCLPVCTIGTPVGVFWIVLIHFWQDILNVCIELQTIHNCWCVWLSFALWFALPLHGQPVNLELPVKLLRARLGMFAVHPSCAVRHAAWFNCKPGYWQFL